MTQPGRTRKPMAKTKIIPRSDAERLFLGVYPCALAYSDRGRERSGDYVRIATLPYHSLELEWEKGEPHKTVPASVIARIEADAKQMAARRGQTFRIADNLTITLGHDDTLTY